MQLLNTTAHQIVDAFTYASRPPQDLVSIDLHFRVPRPEGGMDYDSGTKIHARGLMLEALRAFYDTHGADMDERDRALCRALLTES